MEVMEERRTKMVVAVEPFYDEIWVGEIGMQKLREFITTEFGTPVNVKSFITNKIALLIKKIDVFENPCNLVVGHINLEDTNV